MLVGHESLRMHHGAHCFGSSLFTHAFPSVDFVDRKRKAIMVSAALSDLRVVTHEGVTIFISF